MSLTTTSGGSPSFLSPKNEKAQKLLAWLALGVAGLGVYVWVLPFVLALATMTLKLVVVGSILVVLLMFLLNPRFRWVIGYMVQRSVDLLTLGIINRDPIGIMKGWLREVDSGIENLIARMGDIRGAVQKTRNDLELDTEEREQSAGILLAADEKGLKDSPAARTEANKVLRRNLSIARMEQEIKDGDEMLVILDGYLEQAQAHREDLADRINFTARERKRLKASAAAFAAIKNIMEGRGVGSDMSDEAFEVAREQAAAITGDIQQFVSASRGALQSFQLGQDGAVERVLSDLKARQAQSPLIEHKPGTPMPMLSQRETTEAAIDRFLPN